MGELFLNRSFCGDANPWPCQDDNLRLREHRRCSCVRWIQEIVQCPVHVFEVYMELIVWGEIHVGRA